MRITTTTTATLWSILLLLLAGSGSSWAEGGLRGSSSTVKWQVMKAEYGTHPLYTNLRDGHPGGPTTTTNETTADSIIQGTLQAWAQYMKTHENPETRQEEESQDSTNKESPEIATADTLPAADVDVPQHA